MFGVTGLHFDQLQQKNTKKDRSWIFSFNYSFWVFNWMAGHILGGATFFGLIGAIGSILLPISKLYCFVALGLICLIGALGQLKIIRLPLPQLQRQVSRLWLNNLHKNIVALGYGFQLGAAITTRIKIATTYAVIGCAFCSGSLITGAMIGILFGASRAVLPVALAPFTTAPDKSLQFALRFNSYDRTIQKINVIALFLSGAVFVFSIVTFDIGQLLK